MYKDEMEFGLHNIFLDRGGNGGQFEFYKIQAHQLVYKKSRSNDRDFSALDKI